MRRLRRLAGRLGRILGDLVDNDTPAPSAHDWPPDPKTHDYRSDKRLPGHDYSIRKIEGHILHATGYGPLLGPNIKRGDYLRMSREGGGIVEVQAETRYRVARIEYEPDSNQWSAEMWWIGRPECQTDWPEEDRWRDRPTATSATALPCRLHFPASA